MLTATERPRGVASRIKGRASITRRVRALLIATHRYGRLRAVRTSDYRWTAAVLDALSSTLEIAESHDGRVLTQEDTHI